MILCTIYDTTSLLSRLHIPTCFTQPMDTLTPEEREDKILRILNGSAEGIGFNKLQKETDIPRKTLARYLAEMESDKKINIERNGQRKNSELRITANFSSKSKEIIQRNFDVILTQHWTRYKTKVQKSNVFSHFLQLLAAEYYDYLLINLFEGTALYRFALNRLEENLEKERKQIKKIFSSKEIERLYEACEEVGMHLFSDAVSSIGHVGYRKGHRTRDEISRDLISNPEIIPIESFDIGKEHHRGLLGDLRTDLIKDKEEKSKFMKLAKEYNELAHKIENVKSQLAFLAGTYPLGSELIENGKYSDQQG